MADDLAPPHIMISYAHNEDQDLVKKMFYELKKRFNVWIDFEQMTSGNTSTKMMEGVANSAYIIVCLSKAYIESKNCTKEFRYAEKQKKNIIPCIVEQGFRASGTWIDFDLVDLHIHNFRKPKFTFGKVMNDIINFLNKEAPEALLPDGDNVPLLDEEMKLEEVAEASTELKTRVGIVPIAAGVTDQELAALVGTKLRGMFELSGSLVLYPANYSPWKLEQSEFSVNNGVNDTKWKQILKGKSPGINVGRVASSPVIFPKEYQGFVGQFQFDSCVLGHIRMFLVFYGENGAPVNGPKANKLPIKVNASICLQNKFGQKSVPASVTFEMISLGKCAEGVPSIPFDPNVYDFVVPNIFIELQKI